MRIPFRKMHGAGNDFVVIDHRRPFLPPEPGALFARVCDRRRGVGADGVLLLETDAAHDFRMSYHNADGGRAEFCGNGARCLVRFALELGLGRDGQVRFATDAGPKRGRYAGEGRFTLEFGVVTPGERRVLACQGTLIAGRLVNAGVPHFVVAVQPPTEAALAALDLVARARPLRAHPQFGPEGANVDFVAWRDAGRVAMRTYERGVEGETLACGSGAIATAVWAVAEGARSPVVVCTAGGDDLIVDLEESPEGTHASLTGPAQVAFRGVWEESDAG